MTEIPRHVTHSRVTAAIVPVAPDPYPRLTPDAPVVFRPTLVAHRGATPEQIADEIAEAHDLATPEGWADALRALSARPEVFRRLTKALTDEDRPLKEFQAALKYVTENGVGKPIERHEHLHRGTIVHAHVTPPIAWSDEVPPPAVPPPAAPPAAPSPEPTTP